MPPQQGECFLATGSVTYAQKAQRALAGAAIPSSVTKADTPAKRGCVHGIAFACNQKENVLRILRSAGLSQRISEDSILFLP